MQPDSSQTESVYDHLKRSGNNGKRLADIIQYLCGEATQDSNLQDDQKDIPQVEMLSNQVVHAHWLDLWFTSDTDKLEIERWAICGLSEDLGKTFLQTFWQPYSKRILCGSALTVRENNTTFLERYFNLPKGLPVLKDERPQTQVYVPTADMLPPSGFLCRMSWAIQVGALLYSLQEDMQNGSLLITLNHKKITETLAEAFKLMKPAFKRQILATQFGWTTTKIRERLTQPERSSFSVMPSWARYRSRALRRISASEVSCSWASRFKALFWAGVRKDCLRTNFMLYILHVAIRAHLSVHDHFFLKRRLDSLLLVQDQRPVQPNRLIKTLYINLSTSDCQMHLNHTFIFIVDMVYYF